MLLSGVIMLAAMSVAGVLALRTPWLEQQLGGLDRTYRLHKYLGITAGVMLAVHWLTELSPGTLIDWGWLAPRVKGPKGPQATDLLSTLKGPAKDFGEWAAWAMLALALPRLVEGAVQAVAAGAQGHGRDSCHGCIPRSGAVAAQSLVDPGGGADAGDRGGWCRCGSLVTDRPDRPPTAECRRDQCH